MADVDASLEEQVLDVAKRQRVFDVHHDHETDDLGGAVEIAERVRRSGHPARLRRVGYRSLKFGLTEPWGEFVIEIDTIICGILIALGLEPHASVFASKGAGNSQKSPPATIAGLEGRAVQGLGGLDPKRQAVAK